MLSVRTCQKTRMFQVHFLRYHASTQFDRSIPSFYIHALECHIIAKQEFLAQAGTSAETRKLSAFYDYQHKYVTALIKQLPPGTEYPAVSRSVLIHPPSTIRSKPLRQGPFLLQPSPRTLEGSEGGDATDIFYLTFASDDEGTEGETERLGIVLITHQDGRVDVCMNVENVDPRWEKKHVRMLWHYLPFRARPCLNAATESRIGVTNARGV